MAALLGLLRFTGALGTHASSRGLLLPYGLGHFDGSTTRRVVSEHGQLRPACMDTVVTAEEWTALLRRDAPHPNVWFLGRRGEARRPGSATGGSDRVLDAMQDILASRPDVDGVLVESRAYNLDTEWGVAEYGAMTPLTTAQLLMERRLRNCRHTREYILTHCDPRSYDALERGIAE